MLTMLTQQPPDSPPSFGVTNGEGGAIGIPPEFVSNASADGRRNCKERHGWPGTASDLFRATYRKLGGPSAPSVQFCHDISGWLRALLVILASPRALGSSNVSLKTEWPTMAEHPRISLAPDVLVGKPLIRGTRLSVEFVIGLIRA
jgi:Protein of unknown function (DUF433)